MVPLGKSRQIAVTETAGRLRVIRTMLARMEGSDGTLQGGLRAIELKFARSEDVLPIVRQMLEIPERQERLCRRFDPHRPGSGRGAIVR